ncbi:MAG: hypothetical protein ACJ789_15610 [Thermomicrobiales bacterium]
MFTHRKTGAEALVVNHDGPNHMQLLEEVVIRSDFPQGSGVVRLSPDQALYVHSRLSNVTMAFMHGHQEPVEHLGITHLPDDHEHHLSRCGAKVWPIVRKDDTRPPVLQEVVIESEYPKGHAIVHLSPEQVRYIYERLTQIAFTYLHENAWGGEDARLQ